MPKPRVIVKTAELTDDGLLIRSFELIDANTGETLRDVELNDDLLEMIKAIEINPQPFVAYKKMESKNDKLKLFTNTFNLTT